MRAIHRGFTLIELATGVAITGMLAAVALPAYQDYQDQKVRSSVAEGLSVVASAVAAVTANAAKGEALNKGWTSPLVTESTALSASLAGAQGADGIDTDVKPGIDGGKSLCGPPYSANFSCQVGLPTTSPHSQQ